MRVPVRLVLGAQHLQRAKMGAGESRHPPELQRQHTVIDLFGREVLPVPECLKCIKTTTWSVDVGTSSRLRIEDDPYHPTVFYFSLSTIHCYPDTSLYS